MGSKAIGRTYAQMNKLIALLEHMGEDAQAIYMMGDMFDFWFEYLRKDKSKKQYEPLFRVIRRLIRKGVHVHYFVGNHDLWTWGGLQSLTGMTIHTEPVSITRYGKNIYLGHGDGIAPSNYADLYPTEVRKKVERFRMLRRIFHNPVLQALYRLLPPDTGNRFGYNWAAKSRRKEMANPCPYKGEDKEELVLFAKEQEKMNNHRDFYIFGHRHIELDLALETGARVIILGECYEQWTYASLSKQGEMMLHTWEYTPAPIEERMHSSHHH